MVEGHVETITQLAMKGFYILCGGVALIYVCVLIREAWRRYHLGELYELVEKEEKARRALGELSDHDLAERLSDDLTRKPKTSNGSQEG